ncbi:MAG: aspartate kinase [Chloroflexi bacterium]|nr:aspartate kinase [Chloroflexota bacterium]
MNIVVQKYGGSSIATPERMHAVAKRVAATADKGHQVVVVVSAMGDTTDELQDLADKVNQHPNVREMDALLVTGEMISASLLAMALEKLGRPAISLTALQAGIKADDAHGQAMITSVDTTRTLQELESGKVVVVTGFQGLTPTMDFTTLGRGGSDTTAVALAVALKAERCEIYTDVQGVYTADPRLVPGARMVPEVGYEEMMELAVYGAKVMHPRAVELGEVYSMPILVASSFVEAPGTLIHGGAAMEAKNKVRGIAHDLDVAKVTVTGVPDRPGIASAIFEPLAQAGVSVDTIVQNASVHGVTDLTFTVSRRDLERALKVAEPASKGIGATGVVGDKRMAKVSIVGSGMQNTPGAAATMFRTMYESGINIELITTSEIRITCLIDEGKVKPAVLALHKAFGLAEES